MRRQTRWGRGGAGLLPGLVIGVVLAAFVVLSARPAPAAPAASYVHITIHGVINPIKARYVDNALKLAHKEHAEFLLVSINTPGGLVSSMESITSAFVNSDIPVVGYVEPRNAQATSAGAYILLSTDIAAMAPGTRVGAAHPVAGGGKDLGKTLDEKATNTLVAMAKSLAKRRGRPESFAVSIVRDSQSYTAEEAKDENAIEILAPDTASLMKALDGRKLQMKGGPVTLHTRGAKAIQLPLSWAQRFLDIIADPTIASMLLTLGVMGILYEIASPGIGMGGIVGTVSLLTGLLAMSVLPLDLGGFLLIGVGIVGIVLEVKVPSHGLLALGGVVAIVLGALVLVDESSYFGAVQEVDWRVFAPFVALVVGLFLLLATKVARSQRRPPGTGTEALVGKRGVAKTTVEPSGGSVFLEGARWEATSEEQIDAGAAVEVVKVLRNPPRVVVKRA